MFDHPSKKLVILFGTKTIPVQFKSDKRKGKLELCKILTVEEQGIVRNNANNDLRLKINLISFSVVTKTDN